MRPQEPDPGAGARGTGLGSQRFRRRDRLRRSREFREVSQRGRRRASAAFVLIGADSAGTGRLGLTVSRRVGGAVVRNRIKRCVREWFRRGGHERAAGLDLVVIARPPAAALGGGDIAAELEGLAARLRGSEG